MNIDNYYLLRGHGSLKSNLLKVKDGYGFITFSKNGSSRKSKLNDGLIEILTNTLKKVNKESKSDEEIKIYKNIIYIFTKPDINRKFIEYIEIRRKNILLKLQERVDKDPIDFIDNISISNCKFSLEECVRIEENMKLSYQELGPDKYLFNDLKLFNKLNNRTISLNNNEFNLLKIKIDQLDDFEYRNDLSSLSFNMFDNNNIIVKSFNYLIKNMISTYSEDDLEDILDALYNMTIYTTFYGPGSDMQNIRLNIIGFYKYNKEKCNKGDTVRVKKSGLVSFKYLQNNFELNNLVNNVPCEMIVNKNELNMILNFFYITKNLQLEYNNIFNYKKNMNYDEIKQMCDSMLEFKKNFDYFKTLYFLKVIKNTNVNNVKIKRKNARLRKTWYNINEPSNTKYCHKHWNSFSKFKKKELEEEYNKNISKIKIEICMSTMNLYNFYNQIFGEDNNINNHIRNRITNIVTNVQKHFNNYMKSSEITYDNNYEDAMITLYTIMNKNLPDNGYRDYTSIELDKLIENSNSKSDFQLSPGIYLIPSCKTGDTLPEYIDGLDIFN
jgi:hypothetical protein